MWLLCFFTACFPGVSMLLVHCFVISMSSSNRAMLLHVKSNFTYFNVIPGCALVKVSSLSFRNKPNDDYNDEHRNIYFLFVCVSTSVTTLTLAVIFWAQMIWEVLLQKSVQKSVAGTAYWGEKTDREWE